MRRVLSITASFVLPIAGILLVLWQFRPSWLYSAAFLARPPKAQFWSLYAEAAVGIPIAGLLIFEGVLAQSAKLYFLLPARRAWQYVWLACLLAVAVCIAVPMISWARNWLEFFHGS